MVRSHHNRRGGFAVFRHALEDAKEDEQVKHLTGLVIGMVLMVLGAQGAIRLLVDHGNAGLLRWMPGGFWVRLVCYLVATIAGASLAAWGARKAKRAGSDT